MSASVSGSGRAESLSIQLVIDVHSNLAPGWVPAAQIDLDPWRDPIGLDDEVPPELVSHALRAVEMCPQAARHLVDREPERTGGERR